MKSVICYDGMRYEVETETVTEKNEKGEITAFIEKSVVTGSSPIKDNKK
jgi:hypothetical protein